MNLRHNYCIVAKENLIYFIGGEEWQGTVHKYLADVDRYDVSKNQWDKVADIQEARISACGAAAYGRIFIADIVHQRSWVRPAVWECEVFNETTNEWQFITGFNIDPRSTPKLISVDKLYAFGTKTLYDRSVPREAKVACYDPDKDEWNQNTELPTTMIHVNSCSMRYFKGFLDNKGRHKGKREESRERQLPKAENDNSLRPVHARPIFIALTREQATSF